MMLQIGHRESHDVDIFLDDPQLLPFLNPRTQNLASEISPSDLQYDGSHFLKAAFEGVGEIDFIVSGPKTGNPTVEQTVEGRLTALETIPEIITKKIVYRGRSITPRDVFDIAAASESHVAEVVSALRNYKSDVDATIAAIEQQNPEFVANAIADLAIRPSFLKLSATALERTKEILRTV